jgi:hypothetical protein
MSQSRTSRVRHALPADIEEAEGGIARVAEGWSASWPTDATLPGAVQPGLVDAVDALSPRLGLVLERVRSSALVLPIAIAVVSRLYSTVLLALMPIVQPNLDIPRLTGFRSPFLQWDSQWYLTIANSGYHAAAVQNGPFGGRHDFAFFPAWPTLLRASELFGLQPDDIAVPLANLIFVAAAALIYLVLERQFGRRSALWGVALMAFSPPAYILSMAYSEPLFLLLVAGLFVTRSARLRAILGMAVGVTRLTGVAVAAAAGLRWLRDWRDWRALLAAAAIGVGFAAWWVFIWFLTGDPLGWFQGSAQWENRLGLDAISFALQSGSSAKLGDLAFVGLMLGASLLLARRNLELGAFSLIAIVLSVVGAPVESMPRHALVAFPAFGLIASKLGTSRRALLLTLLFAAVQANEVVLAFLGPWPTAP